MICLRSGLQILSAMVALVIASDLTFQKQERSLLLCLLLSSNVGSPNSECLKKVIQVIVTGTNCYCSCDTLMCHASEFSRFRWRCPPRGLVHSFGALRYRVTWPQEPPISPPNTTSRKPLCSPAVSFLLL